MLINRLPEIADQKQISIRALSRMTGITYTTIRAVYHGERRSIQLEVLEAICSALNVQPGDIYQYVPDNELSRQTAGEVASNEATEEESPGQSTIPDRPASDQTAQFSKRSQSDDWNVWEMD